MNGRCKCGFWRFLDENGLCSSCRKPDKKGVKDKYTGLVRTAIKKKRKITGEKKLFDEIALERPHICVVTNTPIKELTVWNFMHVLPKSTHPEHRLNKENIVLAQQFIHTIYDHGDRRKLEKYEGYKKVVEIENKLRFGGS